MAKEKKLNKFYLGAAFGVSLSTVSGPFLADYHSQCYGQPSVRNSSSFGENTFFYLLGGAYVGLAAACGFRERFDSPINKEAKHRENSCQGRVPLDELEIDPLEISENAREELGRIRDAVSLTNNL